MDYKYRNNIEETQCVINEFNVDTCIKYTYIVRVIGLLALSVRDFLDFEKPRRKISSKRTLLDYRYAPL